MKTQHWDTIVVGSGLGGMTSACLLAQAGQKVLLLERHSVPGGFTHTFKRKSFEWDVGVHYVGQVQNKKSILRKIFDYVTDEKLEWDAMSSTYDQAIIAGETFSFVQGYENQIKQIVEHFPSEERAIRSYFKLVRATARKGAWFFGEKTMPFLLSRLIGWLLRRPFETQAKKTTREVIGSFTSNAKLAAVLCAQCGDYGLSPEHSSFAIHAVVVDHYLEGGSYPRGGARQIPTTILELFTKCGGQLKLNAEVTRIVIEKNRVTGVMLQDGTQLRARHVISNVGIHNTFLRLLSESERLRCDPDETWKKVRRSCAHVCLYVGVNASDAELGLPQHNLWIYRSQDFDRSFREMEENPLSPPPLTYISFPSAKDSAWAAQHPGKATIQVIAACPFQHVQRWSDTKWRKRDVDYDAFKTQTAATLTEILLKAIPQLKGRLEYLELSTPLSTRHFMNHSSGEIYGLEHTPARFQLKFLRPQTRIKGLYLTGQDIVTVGVGGALYSGVLAATVILKKSVMMRILTGRPLKAARFSHGEE